jgi:hypothetical protein
VRSRALFGALGVSLVIAACGSDAGSGPATAAASQANLFVAPQNSTLLVGTNRISVALLTNDSQKNPVSAQAVSVDIIDARGKTIATRPLENISSVYGGIPIYVGIAQFPSAGQYNLVVRGTANNAAVAGNGFVTVASSGPEAPVGSRVPVPSRQAVLTDPDVTISMVDSGVPPDTWHDQTIAQALAAHRPMVLYFGEPGYCPSKTCGPTVAILKQLCTQYCTQLSFQHIEDDVPPGPAFINNSAPNNPAFKAFGLQSDPWVYLVNSAGVITDRFEGPVTLDELQAAAVGTLAGRVPAVSLSS